MQPNGAVQNNNATFSRRLRSAPSSAASLWPACAHWRKNCAGPGSPRSKAWRSRAEGAAESTEGKESHLADVTACAADWSAVGGPTREGKQEPYGGQRVQEQAHCGDGD